MNPKPLASLKNLTLPCIKLFVLTDTYSNKSSGVCQCLATCDNNSCDFFAQRRAINELKDYIISYSFVRCNSNAVQRYSAVHYQPNEIDLLTLFCFQYEN